MFHNIHRHLILPSVRLLRDVASYLNIGHTHASFRYLCNKVKYLDSTELLATLQLDEIHIKPIISYDSGQLYGNASNMDQQQANRIYILDLNHRRCIPGKEPPYLLLLY